jgi:hypothetical protein
MQINGSYALPSIFNVSVEFSDNRNITYKVEADIEKRKSLFPWIWLMALSRMRNVRKVRISSVRVLWMALYICPRSSLCPMWRTLSSGMASMRLSKPDNPRNGFDARPKGWAFFALEWRKFWIPAGSQSEDFV